MSDTSLGLSDEEFMQQDPAQFLTDAVVEEVTETAEDPKEIDSSADADDDIAKAEAEAAAKAVSEAQEDPEAVTGEETVGQPKGDTQTELEISSEDKATESLDTSGEESKDTKGDNPETDDFDYKSAYKKVTEPFKANGTELTLKDPADIVRLMQMGANYQKKMAQMKPNLKVIKMLENNGLLDETKLNNLIDLSKQNPAAVAKLIKESGIDPLDIDADGPANYTPTDHSVSDKEYNLDQVLDDIKDTETFPRTIEVLTKEWDNGSKTIISDNPEIIGIINTHMANGVYDRVNTVMQQEKALGKLTGVSDVEAYRQIAEHLHKNGVLHENTGDADPAKVSSETKAKSLADAAREKKRSAAALVKETTSKKTAEEDNFLGLSDAEFMKKFASQ